LARGNQFWLPKLYCLGGPVWQRTDFFVTGVVRKYQKWTGYFLIDIKIIFIITYIYISMVNLISTTTNNEVNQDIQNLVMLILM